MAWGPTCTSTSLKRIQGVSVDCTPTCRAWTLPSQPAGSSELWITVKRGSSAAMVSATAPVSSSERSFTSTSFKPGYSSPRRERTPASRVAASLRAGMITATSGQSSRSGTGNSLRSLTFLRLRRSRSASSHQAAQIRAEMTFIGRFKHGGGAGWFRFVGSRPGVRRSIPARRADPRAPRSVAIRWGEPARPPSAHGSTSSQALCPAYTPEPRKCRSFSLDILGSAPTRSVTGR